MLSNYLKIAWRNLRLQRSYALLNTVGLAVGMAGALLTRAGGWAGSGYRIADGEFPGHQSGPDEPGQEFTV